jgi:hypothetical protein
VFHDLRLKKFLPVAIIFLLFIALVIYAIFLAAGAVNVTIEVFKSLVDADAALLGFLGIITVFVYNTYHGETRFTEEKIEDIQDEHEDFFSHMTLQAGYKAEDREAILNREYETFKAETKRLENRLKDLRQSSSASFSWTIISATFFVVSIFLAILAMTEVSSSVRFFAAYFAVAGMGLGVACLFAMIWNLRADLSQQETHLEAKIKELESDR